jgi:polar amino acid transport system substrate-binding protein
MRTGELRVEEVAAPALAERFVLVANAYSVISAGTEKTKIDMGKKSLVAKARARPDLVKQVIQKIKSDGLSATLRTVNARLDGAAPLGYSSAGTVIAVGREVVGVAPGDTVACAGAGYANHAELVAIPRNLVARVPENVTADEAAFATLGSIALQGVRLAAPELGETVLVIGLGLLGQIAAQLLDANGVRVLGADPDPAMRERAAARGVLAFPSGPSLVQNCRAATRGRGVDAVLICAGTSSNEPIEIAGEVSRERGRVVVVGAVGMQVPREPYFRKEVSVVISRSYGPGRYDPIYEESGQDYPLGYVRFTEQRNIETFLDLLSSRKIDVRSMITHRFPLDRAVEAYALIEGEKKEPYLGIVLEYGANESGHEHVSVALRNSAAPIEGSIGIAMYGAGNYATATLLPALKSMSQSPGSVTLRKIATASGRSARQVGEQYGFAEAVGEFNALVSDDVSAIMIATRHGDHARSVKAALAAGKHVYVEKPLALTVAECEDIARVARENPNLQVMVGFNRRFAPLVQKIHEHFRPVSSPLIISIRVNAGPIPADSWIHDPAVGGGRLIGEGCHFVDLIAALAQSPPVLVHAQSIRDPARSAITNDNVVVTIKLANGSLGVLTYTSNGTKGLGKEYVEVFGGDRAAVLDDFKSLQLFAANRCVESVKSGQQDKGQSAMLKAWIAGLQSGKAAVSLSDLLASSIATVLAVDSLASGTALEVRTV